jgi:hypothetical protein
VQRTSRFHRLNRAPPSKVGIVATIVGKRPSIRMVLRFLACYCVSRLHCTLWTLLTAYSLAYHKARPEGPGRGGRLLLLPTFKCRAASAAVTVLNDLPWRLRERFLLHSDGTLMAYPF